MMADNYLAKPGKRGPYKKKKWEGLISASIAGMNFDSWSKPWPHGLLLFGLRMLLLAAIGTFTGTNLW
jgi:hypothetical protein